MPDMSQVTDLVEVKVLLSRAEYRRFRKKAAFTGEGTVRAALRVQAEMRETPLAKGKEYRVIDQHQALALDAEEGK